MAFFSKFRDMYKLQKQAKMARQELKKIHIESEADDLCTVTISAQQEIIEIGITEKAENGLKQGIFTKKSLEEALKKALNKALKKAQEIATEKTKPFLEELRVRK